MEERLQPKTPPKRSSLGGRRPSGREQGRVIRRYLGALEASRSNRGTKRTVEGINSRLLKIDETLVSADPLTRLHLTQERIDLHAELVRVSNGQQPALAELEKEFIRVAKSYGDLVGITFAAWRQVGVDADVLERAGIVRAVTGRERQDAARGKAVAPNGPAPQADAPADTSAPKPGSAEAAPAEPVAPETATPEPEPAETLIPEPEPAEAAPTQASLPEVPPLPPPPPPPVPARVARLDEVAAGDEIAAAPVPEFEVAAPTVRRRRIPEEDKT